MKNDYCIIKVYAATGNEYTVKDNLTFDEAQEAFESYNSMPNNTGEPYMYIIGDSCVEGDTVSDIDLYEEEDEYDEDLSFLGSDIKFDSYTYE